MRLAKRLGTSRRRSALSTRHRRFSHGEPRPNYDADDAWICRSATGVGATGHRRPSRLRLGIVAHSRAPRRIRTKIRISPTGRSTPPSSRHLRRNSPTSSVKSATTICPEAENSPFRFAVSERAEPHDLSLREGLAVFSRLAFGIRGPQATSSAAQPNNILFRAEEEREAVSMDRVAAY